MPEFEKKIEKFNKFYLWLLIGVGALLVAAILSAVYIKVSVGIILGICAAVAYTVALNSELRTSLGLKYRRVEGGIELTVVAPQKGPDGELTERHLPSRLMWLDVVAVGKPEKKDTPDTNAEVIFIPSSVAKIEGNALSEMSSLRRIVFYGSPEEWESINKGAELDMLEIVFENTDDGQKNQEVKEI